MAPSPPRNAIIGVGAGSTFGAPFFSGWQRRLNRWKKSFSGLNSIHVSLKKRASVIAFLIDECIMIRPIEDQLAFPIMSSSLLDFEDRGPGESP